MVVEAKGKMAKGDKKGELTSKKSAGREWNLFTLERRIDMNLR